MANNVQFSSEQAQGVLSEVNQSITKGDFEGALAHIQTDKAQIGAQDLAKLLDTIGQRVVQGASGLSTDRLRNIVKLLKTLDAPVWAAEISFNIIGSRLSESAQLPINETQQQLQEVQKKDSCEEPYQSSPELVADLLDCAIQHNDPRALADLVARFPKLVPDLLARAIAQNGRPFPHTVLCDLPPTAVARLLTHAMLQNHEEAIDVFCELSQLSELSHESITDLMDCAKNHASGNRVISALLQ